MSNQQTAPEDMTVLQLLRLMPIRAWWAILGAVVIVLTGSAGLGAFFQSARNDSTITQLNTTIAQLNTKLSDANGKVDSAVKLVNDAAERETKIKSKADYLELFVAYKVVPNEVSKAAFANYVCALWKDSKKHSVNVIASPIVLTADAIHAGLPPDLKSLLISRGVPEAFFENAEHGAEQATATIQKYAQGTRDVKEVHFSDGTNYQVPDEISTAVHNDPRCAPL
jgi:hypothetical protein